MCPGVADEHLWGLVRISPAVGVESAFFERFVRILVRFWYYGHPKVGDREMALRRDEDVPGLQVAVRNVPIVEVVHAQGLCIERWVGAQVGFRSKGRTSSSTHRRATLLGRRVHVDSKRIPESAFG